ncbi:MAG: phosphodiester glycosidase family protein [Rikenellaceae bacterium]|jgi:hypothetical protein|nr:phosphodiester glycosidase family protein [Rikenellaceae bacterium]
MKQHSFTTFLAAVTLLLLIASCGNGEKPHYEFPDPDAEQPQPQPEPTGYPDGLTVTPFEDDLGNGSVCKGYVAVADLHANPKLRFNAVYVSPAKEPSAIHAEFASEGKGMPFITVNGGYFSGGASQSLLITSNVLKAINILSLTRKDASDNNVTVYPVRSAFGQMASGAFEAQWIYCMTSDGSKPYGFLSPLDNDERTKTFMASPPTVATVGAALWSPREAVGGGPSLVRGGINVAVESYWKEVFDGGGIAGTSRQPRTAIGATSDDKIVLIVCDGRNMNGSSGFTLDELASKLISKGVVDAINLDGGGSSTIVGCEGSVLNRPSDTGSGVTIVERKVPTAVVISCVP